MSLEVVRWRTFRKRLRNMQREGALGCGGATLSRGYTYVCFRWCCGPLSHLAGAGMPPSTRESVTVIICIQYYANYFNSTSLSS